MPDQVQNPNINFPDQGSPPVIPPVPVVGAPEAGTNPGPAAPQTSDAGGPASAEASAGKQAAAPMAAVEPVPLPKVTDVEEPAQSPPPADIEADKPAEQNPLFEKPVTVAPRANSEQRTANSEQRKLPKGIIAGIAALVFLVVGLGSGLYLVRQRGIGEIRKAATSGCQLVGSGSDRGCWCASGGWQFHCPLGDTGCETECGNRDAGGPQPTNPPPPPRPDGCVPSQDTDPNPPDTDSSCGGNNEGFCTRCPSGADGQAEYFCDVPNVGVGGGCRAPSGGGANQCNRNEDCPSGQVCQGVEGSKRCQQQSGDGGRSCGNNYIAFRCQALVNGECHENPADFTDESAARRYANASGCGQVDQVWSLSGDRTLCGGFSIFSEGCEGVRPTSPPGPQATSTPAPPGEQPTATPTPVTISANCESLAGQISDGAGGWTTKTDSEFAATARSGDRVRFMCTGAKTRGSFTKSAFFINNILHVDDVVKLNDTQFAVEYTIPAAGTLTVESVLLHDSKGWVD